MYFILVSFHVVYLFRKCVKIFENYIPTDDVLLFSVGIISFSGGYLLLVMIFGDKVAKRISQSNPRIFNKQWEGWGARI